MFVIYRLPHWRYLAEDKKYRSQALCDAVKCSERGRDVLYCTISYTRNGSYIMAGHGEYIFGMDAYEHNRRLPLIARSSDDATVKSVIKKVSMQEAVYKSIRFNDIEISETESSINISKFGIFSFIDCGEDNLTIFHSAELEFDYRIITLQ